MTQEQAVKRYKDLKECDLKTAVDKVDAMAKKNGWKLPDGCVPVV